MSYKLPILLDFCRFMCFLLYFQTHSFSGSSESVSVTSRLDLSMEIHGSSLNVVDIDDINKFLQDYALKTLLPYVEKQISQLTEVVSTSPIV